MRDERRNRPDPHRRLVGPGAHALRPNFLISQSLGKLSGNNLFQSFATFNVGSGESATFVTTTPGLANVISRVTGGSASSINGVVRLSSTGATPDFFFINPAGVTFGKGAQIDVPAAFNVSTANYVKFPDGNFYADLNRTSTLSAAPPEAFGFLGTTRASIAVNGGATLTTSSTGTDQPIRNHRGRRRHRRWPRANGRQRDSGDRRRT
jgi:filamentous hemagglutinin family protein